MIDQAGLEDAQQATVKYFYIIYYSKIYIVYAHLFSHNYSQSNQMLFCEKID